MKRLFGTHLAMCTLAVVLFAAGGWTSAQAQTNTVSAGSSSNCLTTTQTCSTIPIQISRTDATPILAYSVTFTLSANLALCAPLPNVPEGTYLSASGPTSYHVVNLGGGQYRADDVILGAANCGSTAASGTLFSVHVTNTGGSGTGTATINSVTLRNCSNVTIASTVGSNGSVAIDLTPVTVDAISDPTVAETAPLSVMPVAHLSSCASGPVNWTASGLPLGASINPSSGEVTWTPGCTAYENGPDYGPVTVTAHAASLETGSASFTIHVTNSPGTVAVSVGSSFSVEEQSALVMAAPIATLSGCAVGPVTWSVTPSLPAGASLNASGQVVWTPTCGQANSYGPFSLKATAATGEFGAGSFSLVVTHKVGTVTIAAISDPTVAEGALLTVTPVPTLGPCAATPLTWNATGLPAGAGIDTGSGVITWTPPCDAFELGGLYGPVNVTATAATGEFGSTSFSIHVTNTPIAIAAVSPLASVQGPGAGSSAGLSGITISYSTPPGATSVEVYRAGFGNYPEYDDSPGSGSVPAIPSYPPSSPWVLTAVSASGQVDMPSARDFWYYVAFAKNGCGDVSPVSVRTSGTLDYRLGDVTDGFVVGTGDNLVNTPDISYLGAHYGLFGAAVTPYNLLDVGPTSTGYIDGRPLTDDEIGFEDLVIVAINYGRTTFPRALPASESNGSRGVEEVILARADHVAAGAVVSAELRLRGAGTLAALSARLSWDSAVVEPVSCEAVEWFRAQGGIVLSPKPGTIDAALLGAAGVSGEGPLATMTFRALTPGDPKIRLESVDGRDAMNRSLVVNRSEASPTVDVPATTQFAVPSPSPFSESTTLSFSLAQGGPVELSIYSVAGRRVKTLLRDTREPGNYRLVWDGRDDGGQAVGAGVYYAYLASPQGRFTRALVHLR